jgi:hypothetical protein
MLDQPGIFAHWRDPVAANDIKGKNARDVLLVAAMQKESTANTATRMTRRSGHDLRQL